MILSSFFSPARQSPTRKIFFTLLILFFFRLGNTIPLTGIDQEALKKSFLQLFDIFFELGSINLRVIFQLKHGTVRYEGREIKSIVPSKY